MNKLRVLELFGGIGACSKALERLGIDYEIADYVEIDKYAVKSFNAIHNTNFEPQDITQWNKDIEVDLIMHGSPCQDFSLAGLQAGGDKDSGTRSSLMYETIRIVEKLKPKYVIWENVKNLLSKKHKHNFDAYIETMEKLGYKNYYQVLNAKDYGIPQNRERVFTISIRNDINKEFIFPPKQELKLKLKDMLEDNVDEKYYLSEDKIEKISHWKGFQKPFEKVQGKNSIVPTLTARGAGEEHNGMITFSDNLEDTTNLQEQCLNIKSGAYARNFGSKGKLQDKEYCDTLTASMGIGGGNVPIYQNNLRIRKLTPKECWRLMGFDDEDFDKASKVNSNSQLYKQAGNSIVVNVLMAIFNELLKKEGE
jgi:DNA (cytosine-5)-methyltransferase 1